MRNVSFNEMDLEKEEGNKKPSSPSQQNIEEGTRV
jgi:hypothetical protein